MNYPGEISNYPDVIILTYPEFPGFARRSKSALTGTIVQILLAKSEIVLQLTPKGTPAPEFSRNFWSFFSFAKFPRRRAGVKGGRNGCGEAGPLGLFSDFVGFKVFSLPSQESPN